MSTNTGEPAKLGAAISSVSGAAFESDSSLGVLQAPFEGWLAFSDVVSDTDPDMAALMVAAAYVARAVVEEQVPSWLRGLGVIFGLSESALEGLGATLRAQNLAVAPEGMADLLKAGSEELLQSLGGDDQDDDWQIADKAIPKFLASPRSGKNGLRQYNLEIEKSHKEAGIFNRRADWRAVCSLERPPVLGSGQKPIYCAGKSWRPPLVGTRLDALESTYLPTIRSAFSGRVRQVGPVVGDADGAYLRSIDEFCPSNYWGAIDAPTAVWAYGLSLIEGPKSKIAYKLGELLRNKREEINNWVSTQVDASQARFLGVLSSAHIPLAAGKHLLQIITAAAKALVKFITDVLIKTLTEKNLTTWTIWHSVVMGSPRVPISVFMLDGPDNLSPGLCRLDKDDKNQPIAAHDYETNEPLETSTRFMIGESPIDSGRFDARYFALVADKGLPLAWKEPLETNSGFRILVPHLDRKLTRDREGLDILRKGGTEPYRILAKKSKSLYVSALRADVFRYRPQRRPGAAGHQVVWKQ